MAESVMKYGARKGDMNVVRGWIARAASRQIRIFPVPGADIFRMNQHYSKEQEFELVANPREANVLFVMGNLTDALAEKAAVAYAQIPRPRVLVFAGTAHASLLPEPDLQVSLNDNFSEEVLPKIRQLIRKYAWSDNAEPWAPDFLLEITQEVENGNGHHHHNHGNGDSSEENHEGHSHEEESTNNETEEEEHNHSDHDGNGDEDHAAMDFMSMVEMTKDLPRPKDGLPMNRSQAHFGPFHPGLPGGLSIFTELDGDTVIKAKVERGLIGRAINEQLPFNADDLPDFLASLNPLTPNTYRLLARKALLDASIPNETNSLLEQELVTLERERVASHLNWLAVFAKTIGNNWLYQQASRWHSFQKKNNIGPEAIHSFLAKVREMPYLKMKLTVAGGIPENMLHHLSGPVAKAAGKKEDTRQTEKLYQRLSWQPVIKNENNAWGRLLVRLDEIEQSLQLINRMGGDPKEHNGFDFANAGSGRAEIESPRGKLTLDINMANGMIEELNIATPSTALAGFVSAAIEEMELSDVLVEVASLDISPWEIQLNSGGKQ